VPDHDAAALHAIYIHSIQRLHRHGLT
jgi:hypothetical protein